MFTNWNTYGVGGPRKSLSPIWNSSNDVGNKIDVSRIAFAKSVGDWGFRTWKWLQLRTLRCTSLWSFPGSRLYFFSQDINMRRKVRKRKEGQKTDDVIREKPGFEVSKKGIKKANNLLDVTVKFLSSHSGSIFAKSLSFAFGICSKFLQNVFAISQVFIKLISHLEGYVYD